MRLFFICLLSLTAIGGCTSGADHVLERKQFWEKTISREVPPGTDRAPLKIGRTTGPSS
jgi:hypothetical protein